MNTFYLCFKYIGIDLNGDGSINLQDVLLVPEFFENRIEDLDVNMDGKVDLWDLYKLPLNERKTMDGEYTGDRSIFRMLHVPFIDCTHYAEVAFTFWHRFITKS